MIQVRKISSRQLLLMAVGSALVFPYTFMPILEAPPANQDAWIVLLLCVAYIVLLNAPTLFIMNRLRGLTVNQASETVLGKAAGKAACMVVALFCVFCFTACSLITALFVRQYIIPETPVLALVLLVVLPSVYAAIKEPETIGGLAIVLVSVILASTVFFFVMGLNLMKPELLQPILADSTFLNLNIGAFLTAARYSEMLIFWVYSYYLVKESSITKTYAAAIAVFGVAFLMLLLPVLMLFGYELSQHISNPYFVYTRHVEALSFLRRLQSLNALTWFPVAVLKMAIFVYMASHLLSGVFGAKSHRLFVYLLALICVVVCMVPSLNNAPFIERLRSDQVFPYIVLPATLLVPSIITVVYLIRRKKVDAVVQKICESDKEH
ncbi:MAG: endospore germination permease [Clostridiales bacterium]|nr:endospore germination permease [Clostridiales bacterium]